MTDDVTANGALDMDAVPAGIRGMGSSADEMIARLARGENPYAEAPPPAAEGDSNEAPPQPTHPTPQRQDYRKEEPKPTHPTQERLEVQSREPEPDQEQGQEPSWEHRYNSLKGNFDRTNRLLKDAQADAASLRNIIATMEATGMGGGATASAETAQAAYEELTEEEKNDFGPEFLTVVGKVVGREMQAARQEIADLKKQLGGVQNATKARTQAEMHAQLDERIPNWMEINDEPEFIAWAKNSQPGTGASRQSLMNAAYNKNSTADVAYFFETFLREVRGETLSSEAPEAGTAQGRAEAPKRKSLEDLAAPNRGKQSAAVPGKATPKPIITPQDITQFYTDLRTGKYAGKEAEAKAREREIFAAGNEGRVAR